MQVDNIVPVVIRDNLFTFGVLVATLVVISIISPFIIIFLVLLAIFIYFAFVSFQFINTLGLLYTYVQMLIYCTPFCMPHFPSLPFIGTISVLLSLNFMHSSYFFISIQTMFSLISSMTLAKHDLGASLT